MVAAYTPSPFTELRRQLNQLFDDFGFGRWRAPMAAAYPPVNIWDSGDALRVEAELPGIKRDDLEISTLGNELTIKGRWQPSAGDRQTWHRQERPSGEFSRVITLPFEVDANKVDAELKDGVLSVHLPKAESAKPRKITLKS